MARKASILFQFLHLLPGKKHIWLQPQSKRISDSHVLVALMLSSQTKDEETHAAMCKLRKAGGGKLTAEILDAMDENVLHDCIRQVGFHNTKTQFVKRAARICIEEYGGDIPSTIKDLMSLPGVGPKMAFLAMQCGWDVNVGNWC
ncbi:alpha,alpha-trehalase nth1 [Massospora cicadina]|nr:alpha,alpha-trehalase nth1 [Massospora cicadina]